MRSVLRLIGRWLALLLLATLSLQLYFLMRIALMTVVDPSSTTFERSEAWRILREHPHISWRQDWVTYPQIAASLKRAVIASEDARFSDHNGVEWDALEKAWERNQKAQEAANRRNEQLQKQQASSANKTSAPTPKIEPKKVEPKIVGGSTITQQLAKNLFLSGERHVLRKAQEFIITGMLEIVLSKQRILEIYLNHVEWGDGVFGAEAAAQHYFHVSAAQLPPSAAARLAVMLPAPKRFEKRPQSPYIMGRASTVLARMNAVDLP